jgi:transcription-repair coupling factor (superfamily II helicase)
VSELKARAHPLGISKIEVGPHGGLLEFSEKPNLNTKKLIEMIQNKPKLYKMKGQTRLHFMGESSDAEQRIALVSGLIHELTPEKERTT